MRSAIILSGLAAATTGLAARSPGLAARSTENSLASRPPYSRWARSPVADGHVYDSHVLSKRQLPAEVTNYTTITSPNGTPIRYKDVTGKICELTPGVNSYSGYIDLAPDRHSFFYFFEARQNKSTAPITLWLNGGPGSDAMIGLFQELGPCNISENLEPHLNPYAWNENSHMIFLSQPYGVGYSYMEKAPGTLNELTGEFTAASIGGYDGRYPVINATYIDTTDEAAVASWEALQALIPTLPSIDSDVQSIEFNLATESYGGHYGPSFFDYYREQNLAILNGTANGTRLELNSLLIINGIIDESVQVPYYKEFATKNTYNITALNQTVYDYMAFANDMYGGCQDLIYYCQYGNRTTLGELALCTEAGNMCRDNCEGPYYQYGGRGTYDIRAAYADPRPQDFFADYLNLPDVQQALGSDVNYTTSNSDIYWAFQQTGDFVYSSFIQDLADLLDNGIKVSLIYGDADYICNWFGGEAASLAVNYSGAADFAQAGYVPMTVNGVEYGETREHGNFSFTRVYEAGHEVPYYQPIAGLALFQRTVQRLSLPDGSVLTPNESTQGLPSATHTNSFVPLTTVNTDTGTDSAMATSTTAGSQAVNTTLPQNRYGWKQW